MILYYIIFLYFIASRIPPGQIGSPVYKYTVYTYTVYKYTSIQVYKYTSIQVYKYIGIQVYKRLVA